MAKNIEPKLRKIGDYLKLEDDTVFSIPEYQRPYSWEISHCDKLWQDITDFVSIDSKDRYFFGTIIINCQKDDTVFSLIDGQQRTTTFLLLLKALLIKINVAIGRTENDADSENLCRGLKERRRRIIGILYNAETEEIPDKPEIEIDRAICNRKILLENLSINELYKTELKSILCSVDYVEAEFNVIKIAKKQKDNKYTRFFRNFKFFYEKADNLSDSELNTLSKTITDSCEVIEIKSWQVEQAITMFNSLNSDGLPLYDADIISAKLYAEAEKNNSGQEFTELWKKLILSIDLLKQNGIATIDSILMQRMYIERAKNNEIITETGSINVTTPGVRRYYTEINKALLSNPIELCNSLIKISEIWHKISEYPSIQVLFKFNDNARLFLAAYCYRFDTQEINEQKINIISLSLLRLFTILELVDVGYSSSYFKTFLFGESIKLVDSNVSASEIECDFNNHILEKWNIEAINEYVKEYDKNILVYLNEFLTSIEYNIPFSLGTKYDIEHIMPVSGANLDEIRKDAQINGKEEFYNIVNKLGNKILLEEKINRAIGNEWFRTKISTKLSSKTGYIDSNYPIANLLVKKYESQCKPYWNKEDINTYTNKASNRIANFIFNK